MASRTLATVHLLVLKHLVVFKRQEVIRLLADLGEARGCSTNSLVIKSFIRSVIHPFVKIALLRRHGQTVGDGVLILEIDYV